MKRKFDGCWESAINPKYGLYIECLSDSIKVITFINDGEIEITGEDVFPILNQTTDRLKVIAAFNSVKNIFFRNDSLFLCDDNINENCSKHLKSSLQCNFDAFTK